MTNGTLPSEAAMKNAAEPVPSTKPVGVTARVNPIGARFQVIVDDGEDSEVSEGLVEDEEDFDCYIEALIAAYARGSYMQLLEDEERKLLA
jgi:hypothetical protein